MTLFLWGCLVATAALAGEKHETHIEIVTDDTDGGVFEWRSSDADFSDLEVGESKTVIGEDGKEATVTRTGKGLELDVGGRKIDLMEFAGDGDVTVDIDVMHDGDEVHQVHKKEKKVKIITTDDAADVTIISSDEIDEETRARLQQVLKESGKDGEILFLDGSELHEDTQAHGDHEVRIIKKNVEKTN